MANIDMSLLMKELLTTHFVSFEISVKTTKKKQLRTC